MLLLPHAAAAAAAADAAAVAFVAIAATAAAAPAAISAALILAVGIAAGTPALIKHKYNKHFCLHNTHNKRHAPATTSGTRLGFQLWDLTK